MEQLGTPCYHTDLFRVCSVRSVDSKLSWAQRAVGTKIFTVGSSALLVVERDGGHLEVGSGWRCFSKRRWAILPLTSTWTRHLRVCLHPRILRSPFLSSLWVLSNCCTFAPAPTWVVFVVDAHFMKYICFQRHIFTIICHVYSDSLKSQQILCVSIHRHSNAPTHSLTHPLLPFISCSSLQNASTFSSCARQSTTTLLRFIEFW